MKKMKFNVMGMTCSSCVSHVERAVNNLEGIKSVNVNLITNNMIVEFDDRVLNENKIMDSVKQAGYMASLSDNKKVVKVSINKNNYQDANLNNMKFRLIISCIFLIPLVYISMHNMIHDAFNLPIPSVIQNTFGGKNNIIRFAIIQIMLLVPIIYVNRNYYITGIKRLLKKSPNMDTLIALGSGAATLYGMFSIILIIYGLNNNEMNLVQKYSTNLYFESAGMVLTLITFGKYLETKSKIKTTDAITKLINLAPKLVTVIRDKKEQEILSENISLGEIIVIKPGFNIPVDGIVIEGNTFVDESSITGESIPIEKNIGDTLISGTINKNGYIKMKATKVGKDTTLSQIITLVEEASNSKAPISKIADKVSGIFVPIVIFISIITFTTWLIITKDIEIALNFSISVLVISCPCALGLATPVAIMVGTSRAAQDGILIKSADRLEELHLVDTVVLDKTGTITEGKIKVTDIICDNNKQELLKIAASLEQNSEHPIAEAILKEAKEQNIELYNIKDFVSITGRGIKAKIDNINYYSGNYMYMKENSINVDKVENLVKEFSLNGKTCIYFAKENILIGIIVLQDIIKKTSFKAVDELKRRKINVIMVTGDNEIVANSVAKKAGISNCISQALPDKKQKCITDLINKGKKVVFVGDGINDSPALVSANVGIAISSGTDIAIESADIILMKNSLLDVITAIDLSKSVIRNIKLNLFWAFIYNIIGIPIAAGTLYNLIGLKLNPMLGALAMSLSSVCVVTNALRLIKFKTKFKEEIQVEQKIKIIYIDGMQCNHCKMSVERALGNIPNIEKVEVNLENKYARVTFKQDVLDSYIIEVIKEIGFKVKEIK